jgi:hypothetical protein
VTLGTKDRARKGRKKNKGPTDHLLTIIRLIAKGADDSRLSPNEVDFLNQNVTAVMVPPLVNAPYKVDTEAPLASWRTYQTFETAEECNNYLPSEQAKYKNTASAPLDSIKKGTRAFALEMTFARCISIDDPRLKAK